MTPSKESGNQPTEERSLIIEAILTPELNHIEGTAEIRVYTEDENYFMNLPVTWRFEPAIRYSPKSFFHSNIASNQSVECQLILHAQNTTGIHIEAFKLDGFALDYNVASMSDDSISQKVTFQVKARNKPGIEEHQVKLKLSENPNEVEIPVIIYVK